MFGFRKKEIVEEKPPTKIRLSLLVNLGNSEIGISQEFGIGMKMGMWEHYKLFQKWFHGRPQSTTYSFKYTGTAVEEVVLLRERIKGFRFTTKSLCLTEDK